MISKEEFNKRIKENKKFDNLEEEVKYKDEVIDYYLKHEANIYLESQFTGISTHSSKLIFLSTDSSKDKKVKILNYAFERIVNSYKEK